jgi:hypothetical protein
MPLVLRACTSETTRICVQESPIRLRTRRPAAAQLAPPLDAQLDG